MAGQYGGEQLQCTSVRAHHKQPASKIKMDERRKTRKSLYKQSKRRKRAGRVERLKEVLERKNETLESLNLHTVALKKLATKAIQDNKVLKR